MQTPLKNVALLGIFLLITSRSTAQTDSLTPAKALATVHKILTEPSKPPLSKDLHTLLERGAWEALAYVGEDSDMSETDVQEAVPDYYRFKNGVLLLKLIDPENSQRYARKFEVPYRWKRPDIHLLDTSSGTTRDRWEIRYLSSEYLALDMGELRIFFTHTAPQE